MGDFLLSLFWLGVVFCIFFVIPMIWWVLRGMPEPRPNGSADIGSGIGADYGDGGGGG